MTIQDFRRGAKRLALPERLCRAFLFGPWDHLAATQGAVKTVPAAIPADLRVFFATMRSRRFSQERTSMRSSSDSRPVPDSTQALSAGSVDFAATG